MELIELTALAITMIAFQRSKQKKSARKRKCWTKEWILKRHLYGVGCTLFKELAVQEPSDFRNWMRLDEASFYDILDRVKPYIQRKDTNMRESINPEQRLAVTLRYMATGESFRSLHYAFRIGECTISRIVHETSVALYKALHEEFLSVPRTERDWKKISEDFYNNWQFPNCIGSLDGKHVKILPPSGSGSDYRNYKGFFSEVLMALVNSNYEFIYVDMGTNGRVSDGGVWGKCDLKNAIESGSMGIPSPDFLPNSDKTAPYVIVADEAFGLKSYLMRPFPSRQLGHEERIYNYRLSRARRVVENAFGILANRWRFLLTTISVATTERVTNLVLAACCLHNYLCRRVSTRANYIPEHLIDHEDEQGHLVEGTWRNDYVGGTYERPNEMSGHRPSQSAKEIQTLFKHYFNNEGAVEWQESRI